VAGVEDVEDLDRIRDPLWEEFEPRVHSKQGSTTESEMALPFFFLVETNLLNSSILNPPQDAIFQMKINISHRSGIPSTINFQKQILNNNQLTFGF
jgi:hypothetical protein